MNLDHLLNQTAETVLEAGEYIRKAKINQSDIEVKSLNSLVTYVDKTSEKILVEGLSKILKEAGFITEEETIVQEKKEYNWIIDPLDGTTNFIHQLPCYSISVALNKGEKNILGIVYEINQDECFTAHIETTSKLNQKEIKVSSTKDLEDSLIGTGFPYDDFSQQENYLKILGSLLKKTRGARRFGSAAVDLAYTACGRFDAYYENNLNSWDVAAGALIVKQAGGIVSDFNNQDNYIFGKQILAGNKHIHPKVFSEIKNFI
jgi:myo-inositol-1(or 4)-monophosphatase